MSFSLPHSAVSGSPGLTIKTATQAKVAGAPLTHQDAPNCRSTATCILLVAHKETTCERCEAPLAETRAIWFGGDSGWVSHRDGAAGIGQGRVRP